MLWYGLATLLIVSWLIGKVHMLLVSTSEHGGLDEKRLGVRIWTSTTPLVGVWALFSHMHSQDILKNQSPYFKEILLLLLSGSLMYWFFNSVFSSIEVHWYQGSNFHIKSNDGNKKTFLRKKLFSWFVLPILFSAPYLYWIMMIPVWIMMIYALQGTL